MIKFNLSNGDKYLCIYENLKYDNPTVLYESKTAVAFVLNPSNILMLAGNLSELKLVIDGFKKPKVVFTPDLEIALYINNKFNLKLVKCNQYKFKVDSVVSGEYLVKPLENTTANVVAVYENYSLGYTKEEIEKLFKTRFFLGAYKGDELAGFIGMHEERSIGLLEVFKNHRRKGLGSILLKSAIIEMDNRGLEPFSHVKQDNVASIKMHEKFILTGKVHEVYWLN